jgi:endonuclease V-like protein UPF0215 family
MSAFKIRQVKKEIRTLGLASKRTGSEDEFLVVGVVFRGNHWLDGVMRTTASEADITDRSVEMITASRHHPQIRAILIHGDLLLDGVTIDPCSLSREAMRPVIALNFKGEPKSYDPDRTKVYALNKEVEMTPSFSIGLESRIADEILRVASRDSDLPEALRVAGLLLSAYTECTNISFKNDSTG